MSDLVHDMAWREYELARESIGRYDEILFKVRSWWFALTALLVGGFLGLDASPNGRAISAEIAFTAIALIGTGFWFLDAMNKSLQYVIIYLSRDLERTILYSDPHFGPSLSYRYARKSKNRFGVIFGRLTDQVVWPFYLLPILLSGAIFWLNDFGGTMHCPRDLLEWLPLVIIVMLAAIFFTSKKLEYPDSWSSRIFTERRWRKAQWRKVIAAILKKEFPKKDWEVFGTPAYVAGYKIEFSDPSWALFIDYRRTREAHAYRENRAFVFTLREMPQIVINIAVKEAKASENAPQKVRQLATKLTLKLKETPLPIGPLPFYRRLSQTWAEGAYLSGLSAEHPCSTGTEA